MLSTCQSPDRIQAALPNLISQSETLARAGKTTEAIAGFTIVKQWEPDWAEDPKEYGERIGREKKEEGRSD